jgi:hypothetical protein
METEKGIELLNTLVQHRFTFHRIEKELEISNGTLKRVVDRKIKLSPTNYEKIKGYFLSNILNAQPLNIEELPLVMSLRSENASLMTEIARLKPLADSWLNYSTQQLKDSRSNQKTEVKDLTMPTNEIKHQEQPKTNFSINTTPKTLDELKALCPAELTGLERSEWIRIERQKYGI